VWIHKWKKNDWKLSDGGHVKNKEDLIALDEALEGISVKWVWKLKRHTEIFICYKVNSSSYKVRSWTIIQKVLRFIPGQSLQIISLTK
jgi:hypothetical protein